MSSTASKTIDKSVGQRQQSPVEVSTRQKMELPQSYYTQGSSGSRREGEAIKKDPTRHPASLSKDEHKLPSQMRELSLAEPHTVDIENIVDSNWNGKGFGYGNSGDQGSVKARHFGSSGSGGGESRHGVRSREFGDRTQRPQREEGGREGRGRGRGRRQRDTDEEDDYRPQKRKETYMLSDFLERGTQSSGKGEGGGGSGGKGSGDSGERDKEENILNDYIYDEETDQYYPKDITSQGVVSMHFTNDETSLDKSSRHGSYMNKSLVEYDERRSHRSRFNDGTRGRRGSGFHGGHGNRREWNDQESIGGWEDEGYGGRGDEGRHVQRGRRDDGKYRQRGRDEYGKRGRGNEGRCGQRERGDERRYGQRGRGNEGRYGQMGRSNEGRYGQGGRGRGKKEWGMDGSKMREEGEQWDVEARVEHSSWSNRMNPRKQGKESYEEDWSSAAREGEDLRYDRDAMQPPSYPSVGERFTTYSAPHAEHCYGTKERETYRAKEFKGGRTNRDSYTGGREDYRWNAHQDELTYRKSEFDPRGGNHAAGRMEDVRYGEQERIAARSHSTEHFPVHVDSGSSVSSHWEHLEQVQTMAVPATAVKKALDL